VEWRRLYNEKLYGPYSLPNIIRVIKSIRMGRTGHVTSVVGRRGAYRVLVERSGGKRPFVRPRCRWENN
jgi:hypothetical protein